MSYMPVTTGLSDFDALAGPFPSGQITAVLGRPSVGTSAFAFSVARHNAFEGRTVAFINFQIDQDSLMGHLLAGESSINIDQPMTLNEGRIARLKQAGVALSRTKLWSWTPAGSYELAQIARRLSEIAELDLIVIDGYNGMALDEHSGARAFAGLQQIAADRQAAVLLTAYLDQVKDEYKWTVPSAADLSPIDRAVADAGAVIVLHRPDIIGTVPERRGEVDVIAARGWASSGKAAVRFEPEYHRMVDLPNTIADLKNRKNIHTPLH